MADSNDVFELSIFPSFQNPMALINDFCGPDRSWNRKQALPPPNCRYMIARVDGWPVVFVVAQVREGTSCTRLTYYPFDLLPF